MNYLQTTCKRFSLLANHLQRVYGHFSSKRSWKKLKQNLIFSSGWLPLDSCSANATDTERDFLPSSYVTTGRFRRVLIVLPTEKGKSEATSKARPKAKNPRGRRPRGFLAFGLAEDVAKGLHLENPEGQTWKKQAP